MPALASFSCLMLAIFETLLPVLATILAGFGVAVLGWLSDDDCNALKRFTFNWMLPVLLFTVTANADIPADLNGDFFIAYYLSVLLANCMVVVICKLVFGLAPQARAMLSMSATYGNITVVGLPVITLALGEAALLPLFVIVSVHTLLQFSFALLVAESSTLRTEGARGVLFVLLKDLFTSPISLALLAGLVVNVSGFEIYTPLRNAIAQFGYAGVPLGLFMLGTVLQRYPLQGAWSLSLTITAIKLLLLPALVWLMVFEVFSLPPLWAASTVLIAAMPSGLNSYLFAQKYPNVEAPVAPIIVISTLLFMMSAVFWLILLEQKTGISIGL